MPAKTLDQKIKELQAKQEAAKKRDELKSTINKAKADLAKLMQKKPAK
jgi:hypothetical protein